MWAQTGLPERSSLCLELSRFPDCFKTDLEASFMHQVAAAAAAAFIDEGGACARRGRRMVMTVALCDALRTFLFCFN